MKLSRLILFAALLGMAAAPAVGQMSVVRTLNRVDLAEKQNKPLLGNPSAAGGQSLAGSGLVRALMTGLEQGKYPAYDPDKPGSTMSWLVVQARLAVLNRSEAALSPPAEGNDLAEYEGIEQPEVAAPTPVTPATTDFSPCEHIFQFVADDLTDASGTPKRKVRYLEIIWVDPANVLPERKVCAFRYEDVVKLLEQVEYTNPWNEAEVRTLREAFDLRLFNSFPIQVSGKPIQTLGESQQRSSQLIQYEHNLWSN